MNAGSDGVGLQSERRVLGRPLEDEIVRARLIERIAGRWTHRIMLIEAPGGYGKSTAVAQAIRDNDDDPSGVDAYIRCRPSRSDVQHLAAGLLGALEAPVPSNTRAEVLAAAVVSAVVDRTPHDVCLCIDDVHLAGEGVGEWLASLLDGLPYNGHLLVVGRAMPRLKLARLRAADQVIDIGEAELAFDRRELGELANHHHVDPGQLDGAGGWPAVTRLSLSSGRRASTDFVIEEVVEELSPPHRRVLATAVVAGVATSSLLVEAGITEAAADLVREIPLLVDYEDGSIGAHDLWHEISDHLVSADELIDIVRLVVQHHSGAGAHVEGVETAVRFDQWDLALPGLLTVFEDGDDRARIDDVDRWLLRVPDAVAGEPPVVFLRGLSARMAGRHDLAKVLLSEAAAAFEQAGDIEGETTAVLELGMTGWLTNDAAVWQEVGVRSQRIIAAGGTRMRERSVAGLVAEADLRGEFARAMQLHESVDSWDEISLRHAATLAVLLGDVERARRYADLLMKRYPKPLVIGQRNVTYWQLGDPSFVLSARPTRSHELGNHRNELLSLFFESMIGASLGVVPDAAAVEATGWSRSREQTFVALVHAAHDLLTTDEATASAALGDRLDAIGRDDPLMRGELLRYLPYGYVLVDWARDWIDDRDDLGPLHAERHRLVRRFVAARAAPGTPIGELPDPATIMTWLPLPWSIELAVLLASADDRRGIELAAYLADVAGGVAHTEIRRLIARRSDLSKPGEAILAVVAAPPETATQISVCQTMSIGPAEDAVPRQRVRQLLALLVLRDRWQRRELIGALWPDQDADKARANLRATLRHLRVLLEPDRRAGEAAFHLRQHEDLIWLHRSDVLDVDYWRLEQTLAEADALERDHREADRVLELRLAALSMWSPRAFEDLVDVESVEPDLDTLRRNVIRGGCWAAERLLSNGDTSGAVEIGSGLLRIDQYFERAHAIVIGGLLAAGDNDRALDAIHQLLAALDELGRASSAGSEMLIRRFERRTGHDVLRRRSAG